MTFSTLEAVNDIEIIIKDIRICYSTGEESIEFHLKYLLICFYPYEQRLCIRACVWKGISCSLGSHIEALKLCKTLKYSMAYDPSPQCGRIYDRGNIPEGFPKDITYWRWAKILGPMRTSEGSLHCLGLTVTGDGWKCLVNWIGALLQSEGMPKRLQGWGKRPKEGHIESVERFSGQKHTCVRFPRSFQDPPCSPFLRIPVSHNTFRTNFWGRKKQRLSTS